MQQKSEGRDGWSGPFLPCINISLTLDQDLGFSDISRIECGARCLQEATCEAFMFNSTSCLVEKSTLTDEVQVLAEDGCFATKGMKMEYHRF